MKWLVGLLTISVTIVLFLAMKRLYEYAPFPLLLPLLTSGAAMVALLLSLGISYDTYMIGGRWLNELLGPAVVAMAIPLYRHRKMVKQYAVSILCGVTVGCLLALASGIALAHLLGFDEELIYSILPKSVTTPVAMDIAGTLGGIPPLSAVFVMVAGLTGAVFGPYVFKWCHIDHSLGKGVGMGSAAHAIGTSKALEYGEAEGTASSVAMTLCAVFTSILAPLFILLLF